MGGTSQAGGVSIVVSGEREQCHDVSHGTYRNLRHCLKVVAREALLAESLFTKTSVEIGFSQKVVTPTVTPERSNMSSGRGYDSADVR